MQSTLVDHADHAMRHWDGAEPGPVAIGSDDHKRLFCRMLLETHNPYKPAVIDWPPLEAPALARLTSLPIWDIAVQTEGRASISTPARRRATSTCSTAWSRPTASRSSPSPPIRRRARANGPGW